MSFEDEFVSFKGHFSLSRSFRLALRDKEGHFIGFVSVARKSKYEKFTKNVANKLMKKAYDLGYYPLGGVFYG